MVNDPQEHDLTNLKLDVGLLKKDVMIVNEICSKLDVTIDKLQELTTAIAKMLSMHEQKLEYQDQKLQYQEKKDLELDRLIETRRTELLADIKELHSRITTVQRELGVKIEESQKSMISEMKTIQGAIVSGYEADQAKRWSNRRASDRAEGGSFKDKMLENWHWMAIGGITTLAWAAQHINFNAFGNLFK